MNQIKGIAFDDAIAQLEKEYEYNVSDLMIKYWENEELRSLGESMLYTPNSSNIRDIIFEAKKLVDMHSKASVEVLLPNSDCDEVLYFYDGITEEIMPE